MDRGEEKITDRSAKSSSHVADQGDGPLYAQDNDDCTYKAIDQLLEQNAQLLNKILANRHTYTENENIDLLSQARSNIIAIWKSFEREEPLERMLPLRLTTIDEEFLEKIKKELDSRSSVRSSMQEK